MCIVKIAAYINLKNMENKKYEIVETRFLKPGNVIIHNYQRFYITDCGCGLGAGSFDFGEYFWIEGYFIDKLFPHYRPLIKFWSFQHCPIILCIFNVLEAYEYSRS